MADWINQDGPDDDGPQRITLLQFVADNFPGSKEIFLEWIRTGEVKVDGEIESDPYFLLEKDCVITVGTAKVQLWLGNII